MPIPVLSAQSPSFGRISWPAFAIQYAGVGYGVPAYNTEKKFTWWRYNSGSPTLNVGDVLPDGLLKNGSVTNADFANPSSLGVGRAANWTAKGWPSLGAAGQTPRRVLAPADGELWTASDWTRNFAGGVSEPTPGTFRKTSGTTGWTGQVYSTQGFIKNLYLSATTEATTGDSSMIGLNSDPATDASYVSLDYSWYAAGDHWEIFENGGSVLAGMTRAAGDVVRIEYDGVNVKYLLNGVLKRTVARAQGAALYLDSSFNDVVAQGFKDVRFGPIDVSSLTRQSLEFKTGTGVTAATDSCSAGTNEIYGVQPGMRIYWQAELSAPVDVAGVSLRYNDQTGTERLDLGFDNQTVGPVTNNRVNGSFVVPAGISGIQPFVLLHAPTAGANKVLYVKSFDLSLTPIEPALTDDDLLLFLNKNGVPVNAMSASVLDGSLIVTESIYADAIGANQITSEHILAGAIKAVHIETGSITSDQIGAKAIKADNLEANVLSAGFTLTGALQVGTSYWNPTQGFVIPGVVTLAASGASITAALTATSLTVQKDLLIQGSSNQIKGVLNVANGISTPTQAPALSYGWNNVGAARAMPYGNVSFGLAPSLTDTLILLCADSFYGGGISSIVKSTGAANPFPLWGSEGRSWTTKFSPTGGITTVNGSYFLLGQDANRSDRWYIYRLDSSYNKTAEVYVNNWSNSGGLNGPVAPGGRPSIGNDGTNVIVGYADGGNNLVLDTYSTTSFSILSSRTNYSFAGIGNNSIGFVGSGTYDFGAGRIIFMIDGYGAVTYASADASRTVPSDFQMAGSVTSRGYWWDGTRFWSAGLDGVLRTHGTNPFIVTNDASYTWYDGDATSGSVPHESSASPAASLSRAARTVVTVTTPLAPDSGVTDATQRDKANKVRVYMGTNGSSRRLQNGGDLGVDGNGVTNRVLTLDVLATGSVVENASGVATFATAANSPGVLQSAGSSSTVGWQLYGNGDAFFSGIVAGEAFRTWQAFNTGGNLNLSGTTYVDIPGETLTITCPGPSAVYLVRNDSYASTNANHTAIGRLLVDGTAQSGSWVAEGPALTIGFTWRVTGLSAGSHTFKMQAAMAAAGQVGLVAGTPNGSLMIERK